MATKTKSATKTTIGAEWKAGSTGIEVLPPEQSKEALEVVTEGSGLVSFIKGLVPFFLQASQLEAKAHLVLATAKQLVTPSDKAEDAGVQDFIRDARKLRFEVENHWEITSAVSRFHKRLTAKRGIAVDALKSAELLATQRHDRYVADEKRRAEAERERLQRDADARAAADRALRQAEFEAAALAAEESSPNLSVREEKFVSFHCGIDASGVLRDAPVAALIAADAAGYKLPNDAASRLIASDKIRAAITARSAAHSIRTQLEILNELPVQSENVEVEAELNKGDRHRWSATVVDLELLRDAAFGGTYGIPLDLFVVDPAKLNDYARSLQAKIELWPGVVAKRTTTVV